MRSGLSLGEDRSYRAGSGSMGRLPTNLRLRRLRTTVLNTMT